ncbi:MAG: stalk domain-containing protein [Bacillota bacterium]|nr:stalk domain-containing protein [Bacillota bacterium]
MKKLFIFTIVISIILTLVIAPVSSLADYEQDEVTPSGWNISVSSDLGQTGKNLIDGDISTFWHSKYTAEGNKIVSQDKVPYTIIVDFGKATSISGIRYYPRDAKNAGTGIWKQIAVYGSNDGTNYEALKTESFTYDEKLQDRSPKTVNFSAVSLRYVKVVVSQATNDYGTGAELRFLKGDATAKEVVTSSNDGISELTPESTWSYTASSQTQSVTRAFDGDTKTMWHSKYTAEGSTITSHDEAPFEIIANFGKDTSIDGVRYFPRTDNPTGIVLAWTIYGSTDGKNFTEIKSDVFTWDAKYTDKSPKTTLFDATKTVKAVKIVITQGVGGYGTAAEIHFLKKNVAPGKPETTPPAATTTTTTTPTVTAKKVISLSINSKKGKIGDKDADLTASPVIRGGATLVPVRFISEALGADVKWDGNTKTVTITMQGKTINLVIDSNDVDVNGKKSTLTAPAQIIDGSTMVPIRFISETLGCDVSWESSTQTVIITAK